MRKVESEFRKDSRTLANDIASAMKSAKAELKEKGYEEIVRILKGATERLQSEVEGLESKVTTMKEKNII